MIVDSEAFVLHSRKFGDTSKIISFYTKSDGIITTIAKGARLPKNKFGSALEPLTLSEISFYKKNNTDLHLLSNAELIKSFKEVMISYNKLLIGLSLMETISQTQPKNQASSHIFGLINSYLEQLNICKKNEYNLFAKFQLDIAQMIGYEIDFSQSNIGQTNNSPLAFQLDSGEFSKQFGFSSLKINSDTAIYLKTLNSNPLQDIEKIETPINIMQSVNKLFSKYFSYHLDKKITYKSFDTQLEMKV